VALGILFAWKALEYGQRGEIAEELQCFHVLPRLPFPVGKVSQKVTNRLLAKQKMGLFVFEKTL
jgi:hypothetical protein